MTRTARLVATLDAPLPDPNAASVELVRLRGGRTALVQRSDDEVVVQPLDEAFQPVERIRFPAPWTLRFGTSALSPDADVVVFAGTHALRAVDPGGATLWEIRHGCWGCPESHDAFEEYATDGRHQYPEGGSAGFSVDGSLLWAHIRGPLAGGGELDSQPVDEWLLLTPEDGRVLARVDAQAAAAGSDHVPHPDPRQMGLSVGEGQDGAPMRWGRWDGERLTVEYFDGLDLALLDVSPSGARLMTVSHDQDKLALYDTATGAQVAEWDVEECVPRHPNATPEDDEVWPAWDWAGGFVDDATLVAGTVWQDEEWGEGRHWLVTRDASRPEPLVYPGPVTSSPAALGAGLWYTHSEDHRTLSVWTLGPR
ncbi:hypothetical protein ACH4U3_22580 [Streptomyces griseoruber]|uniref:hypothetical protein n=1 Tax=Streptomyces griseoruber TaxID=1943 RepID=UPI0037BAC1B1